MKSGWLWITAAVLGLALGGCGGLKTPKIAGTGTSISKAQTATENQAKTLGGMKKTVEGLTPANVPAQKPLLQGQVNTATDQNRQITAALGTASKAAEADEATIAAAASPDPVKVRLQQFGYSALILGIVGLVVGVIFSSQLGSVAEWLRSGGLTAVIVGVLVLAVAYVLLPLLHLLFWIATVLVGVGFIGGSIWVYLHRNAIVPGIESWFGAKVPAVKKDAA